MGILLARRCNNKLYPDKHKRRSDGNFSQHECICYKAFQVANKQVITIFRNRFEHIVKHVC